MKQTDYLRSLRRRMVRSGLAAVLGLGLTVLGFSMRILNLDSPSSFHTAWQMFAALSTLLTAQALSRFLAARRVLNGPDFYKEKSRIEEEDERSVLIEQMTWTTIGRFSNALLFAGMLIFLALEAMGVFWIFYVQTLALNIAYLILSSRYKSKL